MDTMFLELGRLLERQAHQGAMLDAILREQHHIKALLIKKSETASMAPISAPSPEKSPISSLLGMIKGGSSLLQYGAGVLILVHLARGGDPVAILSLVLGSISGK